VFNSHALANISELKQQQNKNKTKPQKSKTKTKRQTFKTSYPWGQALPRTD